jgi:hypothetical protein
VSVVPPGGAPTIILRGALSADWAKPLRARNENHTKMYDFKYKVLLKLHLRY